MTNDRLDDLFYRLEYCDERIEYMLDSVSLSSVLDVDFWYCIRDEVMVSIRRERGLRCIDYTSD